MKIKIIYTVLLLLFNLQLFSQQKAVIPPLKSNSWYTASTSMPASYGIIYTPSLAGDQNLNTWWSPASNDKETCWLQLNFNEKRQVNYINIHAGSHYLSFKNLGNLYPKNLRIRYALLEFSDGTNETIDLDDVDEIQTIYFPLHNTRYVRIRPLRYYPATKWNDPCISHFKTGYEQ
jgi:hypothetical protein